MNISAQIIDDLNKLFYAHRLTIDGVYDGIAGSVYVTFASGKYYCVDYTYVGDVVSSFVEVLRRAVALAIQVDNTDPTAQQNFVAKVAGIYPDNPDIVHLVLPQQDLWNDFDLNVDMQTSGEDFE